MITFFIQFFLVCPSTLGAFKKFVVPWVSNDMIPPKHQRCLPFFAHENFLHNPSQNPRLLIYIGQLANLYATQLTSTSATPSISPRNRSRVHWCIDGEALESIVGTKFGTLDSNVSSACSSKTS
jgi:hypothetical protein